MAENKALVIFSGGQDSTTCLLLALEEYGAGKVEALSFRYGQRHGIELEKAAAIEAPAGEVPNTFVDGRNALFLLYAAIHAKAQGIRDIIIGVCETDFSGYPDCRDVFVKSMNVSLNLAMDYNFNIRTPLMYLTKKETWALADKLGALDFVRERTHTCYLGIDGGCGECPSCILRERGLAEYLAERAGSLKN